MKFQKSYETFKYFPSTSSDASGETPKTMEYFLIFSDKSLLEMPPEYSKYFGMVEDFAHAMATDTLKAEIPMPGPFTKEGVEIILGYLKMQSSETRRDAELTEYFAQIPVSKLICSLNTAEFMICKDFIKICSDEIAKKLKDLDVLELAEACSVKDIKTNLERFRFSPSAWRLFGGTLKEVFGKEPDWEEMDSSMDLCL